MRCTCNQSDTRRVQCDNGVLGFRVVNVFSKQALSFLQSEPLSSTFKYVPLPVDAGPT